MKIRCKRCGAVADFESTKVCPECFEILEDCGEDFEEVEEISSDAEDISVEKTEDVEENEKTTSNGFFTKIICLAVGVVILLAIAFTAVNNTSSFGYKRVIKATAQAYEKGDGTLYSELLTDEYIDYQSMIYGSEADFNSEIKKQFSKLKTEKQQEFGNSYSVKTEIQTVDECTADEISALAVELPYVIDIGSIDKAVTAEVLYIYNGNGKELKYRKGLIIAEINDKWYILNADDK